ncbi:MAG: DUF3244 domain-containing protein [Saprospiraceae bacterium]
MKTFIFSLMLVASTALGFSATNLNLTINGQNLVLNTTDWNRSIHTVKIIDQEGQVIYSKDYTIQDGKSLKRFNLEKLAAGTYQVEVSDPQNINRQYFTKTVTALRLHEEIESFIKPAIFLQGTLLKVNYLNLNHESTIKILDPTNSIVFESEIKNPVYTKQFNLSRLDKGVYTVIITQNKERFAQNFEL